MGKLGSDMMAKFRADGRTTDGVDNCVFYPPPPPPKKNN